MADESTSAVSAGNGHFANKLYQILSKQEGNVFFSPISAHAVLSLAYQGATGETAECFKNALTIPVAKSTAEGYKNIMSALNSVENVTLHIANKVFVQQQYKLKDSFKAVATDYFLSEAENVNFADKVLTAKKINTWVEQKTHDKIKDLIHADDLDELTRLVLVNAIYFKGNWLRQFDPKWTTTEPFYTSADISVDCQMMHLTNRFNYRRNTDLDAQILQLPYTNCDVSLVILLPNARDGIKKLASKLANVDLTTLTRDLEYVKVRLSLPKFKIETTIPLNEPLKEGFILLPNARDGIKKLASKLANVDLTTLTRDLEYVKVRLSLPKFKIETTIPLNEPLKELGLGVIFSDRAQFPNLVDSNEPMKVSKIIQKAFIEVNEQGAEAAAATGLSYHLQSVLDLRRFLIQACVPASASDSGSFGHNISSKNF